jgi:hypothetical protein
MEKAFSGNVFSGEVQRSKGVDVEPTDTLTLEIF